MLESVGFKRNKISHAHDGIEALEKAREKTFDVILMDWYHTSPMLVLPPRVSPLPCSCLCRTASCPA